MPRIDSFLLVAAAGQTLKHRLKECVPMIPAGRLIGTVLNKSMS